MKSRNKLSTIMVAVVALLLLAGGLTYANYRWNFLGDLLSNVTTDNIAIEFLSSNENTVNLSNALPMSDDEGVDQEDTFDFAVTSKTSGSSNVAYTLTIEKLTPDAGYTMLDDEDIKVYLEDYEGNVVVGPVKVSELSNYVLYSGNHYHNSTTTEIQDKYKLRIWIDESLEDEAQNWDENTKLQYKFKINSQVVSAEYQTFQTVTLSAVGGSIPSTNGYTVSGTTATKKVATNTKYGTLPKAAKSGYIFNEWNTKSNGSGSAITKNSIVTGDITLYAQWEDLAFENKTITMTSQTTKITAPTNGNGTYTYVEKSEKDSSDNTTNYFSISGDTITASSDVDAGEYTYVIEATDTETGAKAQATYTLIITKKNNSIMLTCASLTYTGSAQNLLSAKSASGGTVYIATTELTSSNYSTTGSSELSGAQGTNAGDYTVYAYTPGNSGYKAASASKECSIAKADNPTTFDDASGLEYGDTGAMVTVKNKQGTPYYAVGTELTSSNYESAGSTTIPTASSRNAGSYTVYYYIPATSNYKAKSGHVDVTIGKKTPTLSLADTSGTLTYGTNETTTITYDGDGTLSCETSDSSVATCSISNKALTITPKATTSDGKTATITVKAGAGSNYSAATNATYAATVNRKALSCPSSPSAKTYSGEAQASGITCPTGSTAGGDTSETDADTYSQTCTANSGYKFSSACSVSWTINPLQCNAPTNLAVSTAGKVTWTNSSNCSSATHQVKVGSGSYATATSGVDKNSDITSSTGSRTVYVKAVAPNSNYTDSDAASVSKTVHSVDLTKGTGISSVSGAGNYIAGSDVAISASASSGWSFSKWTQTSGGTQVSTSSSYTISSISSDIAYTANATGNTYTATFYYQSSTASGTGTVTSTTAQCTVTSGSSCTATIPSEVTGSGGTYNNKYAGLRTAVGANMSPSVAADATSVTLSANADYYSLYKTAITIYSSNTTSGTTSKTVYQNQWFTSKTALGTTVISSSATGTSSDATAGTVADGYSTLVGFNTSAGQNTQNVGDTIAALGQSDSGRNATRTVYQVNKKTEDVEATFYYSNSTVGAKTNSTASGTKTTFLRPTSTSASGTSEVDGSIIPPSTTAPYGTSLLGWATNASTMSTTTVTTDNSSYYAVYQKSGVRINYYSGSAYTTRTDIYRNGVYGTNTNYTMYLATSATGTSNYSTATGPNSATWAGLSTGADATPEYTNVGTYNSGAAYSSTNTFYTVYQYNVTYAVGSNVSSIGNTSGNCKIYASSTSAGTSSCTVILPTITANSSCLAVGWSTTSGATTGTAAGSSYTISNNSTTLYANAVEVWAENLSYDPPSGLESYTDVQAMIDYLAGLLS